MKLNYRAEIDGLRALAVIAVILYHAQLHIYGENYFKGGFIGVDIFLVISGYLISSLILKELQETGKFSFKIFYERRARRILPALFFIMLVSLPFAWQFLLPSDFTDFSKSILFSIGFTSNIYFYFTGLEYGAVDALLKPFLHTWSLSVEEQFYIFFPLLILFIYKFFTKRLFDIFIILLLISLITAHITSNNSPSMSFYFLHTRMWELLAGSVLAYLEIKYNKRKNFDNKFVDQILPLIGLALITYSIIFYNDKILHPSFHTLYPIIGTCLIIWFARKDEIITKILSSKLFVSIGLISYSLYLWHYPVFAFFRYSLASGSMMKKILIMLFIILASVITYFFIEKPFRNKKKISLNFLIIFLLSIVVTLFTINIFIIKKNGFDKRYVFENIDLDNGFYRKERANFNKTVNDVKLLKNKKKNILIIGNSHGEDFFNIFYQNKSLFPEYNFFLLSTEIFCLKTFLINKTLCNKKISKDNLVVFKKSNIIILSSRWRPDDIEQIDKILSDLKKTNKQIILTTAAPEFKTYGRFTEIDKFILSKKRLPSKNEIKMIEKKYFYSQNSNKYTTKINRSLNLIALKQNIKILNKSDYHCNFKLKKCDFLTNEGKKINFDRDHYTIVGAKYLGKLIFENKWLVFN